MPVHSSKSANAPFRRAAVCVASFKHSKCNKHITASFPTRAVLAGRAPAPRAPARGIPPLELTRYFPSLTLMSPSNFHRVHTFLRLTNTCHCLVMMSYINIQRIALLFRYFFPSHQTYPKAALLASLLPLSPLHTPPRIRGTADSQAADHVCCAATPARKRDTRLASAGFRPPVLRYTYIYIALKRYIHLGFEHQDGCLANTGQGLTG